MRRRVGVTVHGSQSLPTPPVLHPWLPLWNYIGSCGVTRRAGVDRARSSGRSGSEFGRTWLQRAGRCADSSFVSGI